MIDASVVKEIRNRTGISIKEIKKALEESGGDKEKALGILKEHGASVARKRSDRDTGEGVIEAYIHSTKRFGALVSLKSETDFVARNKEFQKLAHDLAMQVASMDPADVDELLAQPFIKDPAITVDELIKQHIGKLGENIQIERIIRFSL